MTQQHNEWPEDRTDRIGQNGNTGEHYPHIDRRAVGSQRGRYLLSSLARAEDPPRKAGPEADPNGVHQHAPGAKLDAGKVRADLIISGMPRALLAVARVATFGAEKYTENGWQDVPDGVKRYTAALDRHRLLEGLEEIDPQSGLMHAAHLAWNALARLDLMLRESAEWTK